MYYFFKINWKYFFWWNVKGRKRNYFREYKFKRFGKNGVRSSYLYDIVNDWDNNS